MQSAQNSHKRHHLIIAHKGELYAGGHRQAVGRWLLALPDSFIAGDPARAVDHFEALLYVAHPDWRRWLRRARDAVGEDRPDLVARLELYEAGIWAGRAYLDRTEHHIAKARALRPAGVVDPWEEMVDGQLARLLVLHGDIQRALVVARDLSRRPRQLCTDLAAHSLVAAVSFAAGEPGAEELVADAIAEWRGLGEPERHGMVDALSVGSALALSAGDVDEAENLAAVAVGLMAGESALPLKARAEIALANVEVATGRPGDARRRMEDLRRRSDKVGVDPALTALIDAATPKTTTSGLHQVPKPRW